uniref:Uncharacterized protein n=1 Tax=Zonotrichia albicollis TaxID=44394 RepID=A0A8D2LZQ6_ZONAL
GQAVIQTLGLCVCPGQCWVHFHLESHAHLYSHNSLVLHNTSSFTPNLTSSLLTILEVAVAIIQAYVFVLLLSLYLQENI